MRRCRYTAISVSISLAIVAAGCGKRDVNAETRVKQEQQTELRVGVSAALLKLKQAVQKQPKSGKARYELGAMLLAEGDHTSAVIELKHALELQYPEAVVLPKLAEAMLQSGQLATVISNYANTKLTDPSAQAQLLSSVARAMAIQGDIDGAAKTLDAALASDATSPPALLMKARLAGMQNDVDRGLATLDDMLVRYPKSDAAWVLKGELLQRRSGGAKESMQAYERALQISPTNTVALSAMVALYIWQGDLDNARAQMAVLKKIAPAAANTAYVDGHLAYAAGDHGRAREHFQSLLRVLPDDVNVLMSAGENELKLDATLQAESLFAKALALVPANSIARRLLARAQLKLGKAQQALATLAPLVDADDASADALFLAANAQLVNGEARAAGVLYARLAKLKPADPQLRTAIAVAGFGKQNDDVVIKELHLISDEDRGASADLAIISAHQQKGRYAEAIAAAGILVRKQPNDPMVYQLRGQLMALKSDAAGARQNFEQALKLRPIYFPSVAALAALDLLDKQPASARKRFETLLKLQPNNAAALLALAEISAKQGAPRAIILKELNAAAKAAPGDPEIRKAVIFHHLNDGETDLALAAARAAVAAYPDSIELLDLLARCQMRAKQTEQALTSYGKIASLNPKSPHANLGMVDVHLANNDLDAAQRAVTKLLDVWPDLPAALGRAAVIAIRKNQAAEALVIARRLHAKPESAREGLLLEGQIEFGRGNWPAAAAALRQAVEQYDSGNATLVLHTTLLRSGKPAEAQVLATKWLSKHPRDAGFLFYLGSQAELVNNTALAEQRYREALDVEPSNILALNNLAMLLVQQKKAGAVALAERAVAGAQDKATYLDTLAQAYAAENDVGKAIDAQKRAVALAPQEHDWRLSLAKLQLQAGNKAAAKAELDKLSAVGSSFSRQSEVTTLRDAVTSLAAGR